MVSGSPYTPPVTRATFRRTVVLAAIVGGGAVVALVLAGYPGYAAFGVLGLGLGALNLGLAVRSVAHFASAGASKAAFSGSVLARLAVITVAALAFAVLFRPYGIAVFGGLALFQLLAIVSSALPLIKEIRQR